MRFRFQVLALFVSSVLTACVNMPSANTSSHFYSEQHSGIASITRSYKKDDQPIIDFLWQAKNNNGSPSTVSGLHISDIHNFNSKIELKAGEKLKFKVTHFFNQQGATTPSLIETLWSLSDDAQYPALAEPVELMRMERPARCVNQ